MKKLLAAVFLLLCLAYLAWPYYFLHRLNGAVVRGDSAELEQLVDIGAVRTEITRKLNKDVSSAVGEVSNQFVDWLQDGIRRLGGEAVERLVTLEWVEDQLLSKSPQGAGRGFIPEVSYAFFETYDRFLVRIGEVGKAPVHFRIRLVGLDWKVTAVYN